MKITVFGATGFIGRRVVRLLESKGIDVTASGRDRNSHDFNNFIPADITDYESVENVVEGSDIVINLAATSHNFSLKYPVEDAEINIIGNLNIVDASKKHDVDKIIFSSTSMIYGDISYSPVDELHPASPNTPYGLSKYTGEQYIRLYKRLYDLDYVILRFFNIYGPGLMPETGALIPSVYRAIKEETGFFVRGNGNQVRDYTYVDDVAGYILRSITNEIRNETVNIGSGTGTSVNEIISLMSGMLDKECKTEYIEIPETESARLIADTGKLKNLFGFAPPTPLKEGIMKTCLWLDEYYRLKQSGD